MREVNWKTFPLDDGQYVLNIIWLTWYIKILTRVLGPGRWHQWRVTRKPYLVYYSLNI